MLRSTFRTRKQVIMSPKKIFTQLLPYGIIVARDRMRTLRSLGFRPSMADWLRTGRLIQCAEGTGLHLLPPGCLPMIQSVVDVGANTGEWSAQVLDLAAPSSLTIVEPDSRALESLRHRWPGRAGITLEACVIGGDDGSVVFNSTRDSTGASVLKPSAEMSRYVGDNWKIERAMELPMKRLDTLCASMKRIDMLKIDVQGYEMEALKGAGETLKKTVFLLIELNYCKQYEGGAEIVEVHECLTEMHGFEIYGLSSPLIIAGRATMSDGLYFNPRLLDL